MTIRWSGSGAHNAQGETERIEFVHPIEWEANGYLDTAFYHLDQGCRKDSQTLVRGAQSKENNFSVCKLQQGKLDRIKTSLA